MSSAKRHSKRPTWRATLGAGVLAGAAYATWRWYQSRMPEHQTAASWDSQPFPYPPIPRAGGGAPTHVHVPVEMEPGGGPEIDEELEVAAWMDPVEGSCPASHPVKAKLASGIYHLPGGLSYDRTKPDRCYLDAPAAEADGLRAAKR